MKPQRKAHGNSVLKTLPPARQAAIAERAATETLAETVAWLRADGLTTSVGALSEFLSWFQLRERIRRREQRVDAFLQEEVRLHPELGEEELFRRGQRLFSMIAMAEEDPKAWTSIQRLHVERDKLAAAIKTKIDAGLDALYEQIKASPEAVKLFEQIRAVVKTASA